MMSILAIITWIDATGAIVGQSNPQSFTRMPTIEEIGPQGDRLDRAVRVIIDVALPTP